MGKRRRVVKGAQNEELRLGGRGEGDGHDLRMRVARARVRGLYDFAYFTLKAFSRLMDDFSLTNSDCELSAREIPRDETVSRGWKKG